jgi:phosphoglycerate dehydrogenase-like enzyme
MKAILSGHSAANREELLRNRLATDWDIVAIPDMSDLDKVRSELADADAFIGNAFPDALREATANLKLIHCTGAGVDAISLASIPPGCTLCNVHEHEIPMAEHVMLTVLLFVTRLIQTQERFRRGEWVGSGRTEGGFHDEAYGKTLGLIGYGHIGREVARRAKTFGMRVAAVARKPRDEPDLDWYAPVDQLDALLEMSDFVVVICPLTAETRGLLGERQLRKMKASAFLINVARAEIVDEVNDAGIFVHKPARFLDSSHRGR